MLLLVSGATLDVEAACASNVGVLFVPRDGSSSFRGARRWAADNGVFSGFDADGFLAMLGRLKGRRGCLFVVVPDVVGDAKATLEQFYIWAPIVRAFGFPVALAAQDGLTVDVTPWHMIDALFIGGSTEWKLSRAAEELLAYAAARGKWRHVGRVNTLRRMRHFHGLCDSIDGSGFSKWPKRIQFFTRWKKELEQSPRLELS